MIKKYLPYSLQVLKLNLIISTLVTFLGIVLSSSFSENNITLSGVMYLFILSFLTGGYLLGILYFELARQREYYFYYNMGISKLRLMLMTYLFHLIVAVFILICAVYAKQI